MTDPPLRTGKPVLKLNIGQVPDLVSTLKLNRGIMFSSRYLRMAVFGMGIALGLGLSHGLKPIAAQVPEKTDGSAKQAPEPRSLVDLARARVDLARSVVKNLKSSPNPHVSNLAALEIWLRRLAETQHLYEPEKDKVLDDLRAYLEFRRSLELQIDKESQAGLLTELDLNDARYKTLEAETWLAEALQKHDRKQP